MPPVKVMIVDDSVVIRRLLSDALSKDPMIEIAATASNGKIALDKMQTTQVDVMVLDVEMPVLDGIGTLRELRKRNRRLPVIMFSTLTERGARATFDALAAGASDYVTKPANVGSIAESRESVRTQLVPRILALAGVQPTKPPPRIRQIAPATAPAAARPTAARPIGRTVRPRVLVIGTSTGGPEALNKVIPRLPGNLSVPVLVVQHMPPVFTAMLAERLDRQSELTVREAAGGESLVPGTVYIAPGESHLEIVASDRGKLKFATALSKAPPENFCRPSVDVLFRSAAKTFGASVLGVVLTGMGADGCLGAGDIVAAGGQIIVQDKESSVVWGMPGAVAGQGLADETLPISSISAALVRRLTMGLEPVPSRHTIVAQLPKAPKKP